MFNRRILVISSVLATIAITASWIAVDLMAEEAVAQDRPVQKLTKGKAAEFFKAKRERAMLRNAIEGIEIADAFREVAPIILVADNLKGETRDAAAVAADILAERRCSSPERVEQTQNMLESADGPAVVLWDGIVQSVKLDDDGTCFVTASFSPKLRGINHTVVAIGGKIKETWRLAPGTRPKLVDAEQSPLLILNP